MDRYVFSLDSLSHQQEFFPQIELAKTARQQLRNPSFSITWHEICWAQDWDVLEAGQFDAVKVTRNAPIHTGNQGCFNELAILGNPAHSWV